VARVYERVGFQTVFHYRSCLLENPAATSGQKRQLER